MKIGCILTYPQVKCGDKVCKLIIYSESNMNVVPRNIVNKFQLAKVNHPPSYKVVWVNDTALLVSKKCLITFKMGFHRSSIW